MLHPSAAYHPRRIIRRRTCCYRRRYNTGCYTPVRPTTQEESFVAELVVTEEDTTLDVTPQCGLPPKKNHSSQNLLLQKKIQQGMLHPSAAYHPRRIIRRRTCCYRRRYNKGCYTP